MVRLMAAKVRLSLDHPLAAGQSVPLSEAQAHYLFSVMRLQPGAEVLGFDGRDGVRGEATVLLISAERARSGEEAVDEHARTERELDLRALRRNDAGVLEAGDLRVPAVSFVVRGPGGTTGEIATDPVPVKVLTNLPPPEAPADGSAPAPPEAAPLKPALEAERNWWPTIAAAVLAALAAVAAFILVRRLRARKPEPEQEVVPKKPLRPAWELALEELDRIAAAQYVQRGEIELVSSDRRTVVGLDGSIKSSTTLPLFWDVYRDDGPSRVSWSTEGGSGTHNVLKGRLINSVAMTSSRDLIAVSVSTALNIGQIRDSIYILRAKDGVEIFRRYLPTYTRTPVYFPADDLLAYTADRQVVVLRVIR